MNSEDSIEGDTEKRLLKMPDGTEQSGSSKDIYRSYTKNNNSQDEHKVRCTPVDPSLTSNGDSLNNKTAKPETEDDKKGVKGNDTKTTFIDEHRNNYCDFTNCKEYSINTCTPIQTTVAEKLKKLFVSPHLMPFLQRMNPNVAPFLQNCTVLIDTEASVNASSSEEMGLESKFGSQQASDPLLGRIIDCRTINRRQAVFSFQNLILTIRTSQGDFKQLPGERLNVVHQLRKNTSASCDNDDGVIMQLPTDEKFEELALHEREVAVQTVVSKSEQESGKDCALNRKVEQGRERENNEDANLEENLNWFMEESEYNDKVCSLQRAEDLYQELKQKRLEAIGNKRKTKSKAMARAQSKENSKKARTHEEKGSRSGKSSTNLKYTSDNENEQELQEYKVRKLFPKESSEKDDVHRDIKKFMDHPKSPVVQTTQHDHSSFIDSEQILRFYYHSIMQWNRNALYPHYYVNLINNMMNNASSGSNVGGDPSSKVPFFYETHSSYDEENSMNSIQNKINSRTTVSNNNDNRHLSELQNAYQYYREIMLNKNETTPLFQYKNRSGSFHSVLKPKPK